MEPEQITYPPLDTLKSVTAGVWIVDSGPITAVGFVRLPIRMTVLRLRDGSLLLHSPTRFTAALKQELDRVGKIAHLIAPNSAHWWFLKQWQDVCPEARTWAAPGLSERRQVRRSGVRIDQDIRSGPLPRWPDEIDRIVVEGFGFTEVALFVRRAKLLVLTDLVLNLEPAKVPLGLRAAARFIGVLAPNGKAPIYVRAIVKMKGSHARKAAKRLIECRPQLAIFAHGRWFDRDAEAQLTKSLAWLIG